MRFVCTRDDGSRVLSSAQISDSRQTFLNARHRVQIGPMSAIRLSPR